MAAMPWEFMFPTDEMTVPNRNTIRTSHRMPSAARSERVELVRLEDMDTAVIVDGKGAIVTSPRGYDQP
jgi:hypothetical protein